MSDEANSIMTTEGTDERYPDINFPAFKSNIPDSLFRKAQATDLEIHLLNALNCREQETAWAMKEICENRRTNRELNHRLVRVEKVVGLFKSYKGVFAVLFVAAPTMISIIKFIIGVLK